MKECVICTKLFEPKKKWSLCCCTGCSKERNRIMARFKYKYEKKHGVQVEKKQIKKKQSLAEINKQARKSGVDYGTLVARIEYGMR